MFYPKCRALLLTGTRRRFACPAAEHNMRVRLAVQNECAYGAGANVACVRALRAGGASSARAADGKWMQLPKCIQSGQGALPAAAPAASSPARAPGVRAGASTTQSQKSQSPITTPDWLRTRTGHGQQAAEAASRGEAGGRASDDTAAEWEYSRNLGWCWCWSELGSCEKCVAIATCHTLHTCLSCSEFMTVHRL